MGNFDLYCAFCGGPTYDPHDYKESEYTEPHEVFEVSQKKYFQWLEKIRITGVKNSQDHFDEYDEHNSCESGICHFGPSKPGSECFLSGIGRYTYYGMCEVPKDTNAEATTAKSDDEETVTVSFAFGEDLILFHDNCLKLLQLASRHQTGKELTIDEFSHYLVSRIDPSYTLQTTLPLGETIRSRQGQFYQDACKENAWELMDFMDSPDVRDFTEEFARTSTQDSSTQDIKEQETISPIAPSTIISTSSPLDSLPTELITKIFCHLRKADVVNFRCASRSAAVALLTQEFWRSRILLDLPPFFEFGLADKPSGPRRNWKWLYRVLSGMEAEAARDGRLDAWWNRDRLWRVLVWVVEDILYYQGLEAVQDGDGRDVEDEDNGSVSDSLEGGASNEVASI